MSFVLRKVVSHSEEVHIEGGKAAETPLLMCAVAAVITNPWAGEGFVEDLRPKILDIAPKLGDCLLYTSPSPRDGLLSRMPSSA